MAVPKKKTSKGKIRKNFVASNDLINGDEMHLINVFNNLRIGSTYALILEAFKLGS